MAPCLKVFGDFDCDSLKKHAVFFARSYCHYIEEGVCKSLEFLDMRNVAYKFFSTMWEQGTLTKKLGEKEAMGRFV